MNAMTVWEALNVLRLVKTNEARRAAASVAVHDLERRTDMAQGRFVYDEQVGLVMPDPLSWESCRRRRRRSHRSSDESSGLNVAARLSRTRLDHDDIEVGKRRFKRDTARD